MRDNLYNDEVPELIIKKFWSHVNLSQIVIGYQSAILSTKKNKLYSTINYIA